MPGIEPETVSELQKAVEELFEMPDAALPAEAESIFAELRNKLACGEVRAAEPDEDGWRVNAWVKKGILLGFRLGHIEEVAVNAGLAFVDKHTLPTRRFRAVDGVRVVPGGSSIRDGAYLGRNVVCMPPMYVNIGAYIDEGTMIDSHALVGSCAQVGKRVHLSAAAQIGGVLEPVGAMPVIIEDGVLVGGNCGVYEGTVVKRDAVVAAGTILTGSTPVYDLVHERVLRGGPGSPLTIPAAAVVVPGSRPARGELAARQGLHLYTPLIVKYRDPGTDAAAALEEALRD
ncbi:MAG: 2,3,4,5-tetrahydropyridine-2,6-dicarboxylate N-succinyltransferase [Acidobacteriota bacterium]